MIKILAQSMPVTATNVKGGVAALAALAISRVEIADWIQIIASFVGLVAVCFLAAFNYHKWQNEKRWGRTMDEKHGIEKKPFYK